MTTATIVVSWVSFNNDPYKRATDGAYVESGGERIPGPALEILFNPGLPLSAHVTKLYLLARRPRAPEPGSRRVHPRETDVVEELRAAIAERSADLRLETIWWDTDAPPTDHRELFLFTAQALSRIRRENPRAEIAVNLSPGTGAMQTVMLLALQARLAGDHVRAFEGTPRDKRRSPADVLHEVPWNLLAELASTPTGDEGTLVREEPWTFTRPRSKRMREVAAVIERFGGAPFPVLILGARGTGKTAAARRIRDAFLEWTLKAPDQRWEFHLNCAEFRGDPNMLRGALFGQAKGAHSTAEKDQAGVLEKAAGDCVFLDEIHWMDPQAQGLLLLALQREGTFRRIGSDKAISAAFRLLAATNQPRHVLRERLAPDFLDRISDLVVELPELRDCREDLGDIWRSVVRRACDELCARDGSRAVASAARSRVDALVAEFEPHHVRLERALATMHLPGNFRDLERLARRLLVAGLARGRFLAIREEHVREELDRLRKEERADADRPASHGASLADELPTVARCEDHLRDVRDAGAAVGGPALVDEWERRLLVAAHAVAGSGAQAAALLGMNARTFNAKMEKWGSVSDGRRDGPPRHTRRTPGAR